MKVGGKGKKKLGYIPGLVRNMYHWGFYLLSQKEISVTIIQRGNNGEERKGIVGYGLWIKSLNLTGDGWHSPQENGKNRNRVWAIWEGHGASTPELLSGIRCSRLSPKSSWPEPLSTALLNVLCHKVWIPFFCVSCSPSLSVTWSLCGALFSGSAFAEAPRKRTH